MRRGGSCRRAVCDLHETDTSSSSALLLLFSSDEFAWGGSVAGVLASDALDRWAVAAVAAFIFAVLCCVAVVSRRPTAGAHESAAAAAAAAAEQLAGRASASAAPEAASEAVGGRGQLAVVERLVLIELLIREVAFTCILVTAYPVVSQFGAGPAFSGLIISAPKISTIPGLLFGASFDSWDFRNQILLEPVMRLVGIGLFLLVAAFGQDFASDEVNLALLVAARLLEGLGSGIAGPATRTLMVLTARDQDEVSANFTNRALYQNLGQGFGPAVGAFGLHCWTALKLPCRVVAPSATAFVISIAYLAAYLSWFPRNVVRSNSIRSAPEAAKAQSEDRNLGVDKPYRTLVALCFALGASRTYACSNIESAMGLILNEWHWGYRRSSVLISLTFLACLPASTLYSSLRLSESGRARFLMATMVVCAMTPALFMESVAELFYDALRSDKIRWFTQETAALLVVVVADVTSFPLLVLGGGILDSIAQNFARHDAALNLATVSRAQVLCLISGRALGPVAARAILHGFHRDGYALSLILVNGGVFLVYALCIYPWLR